jgi:hypothetical protein
VESWISSPGVNCPGRFRFFHGGEMSIRQSPRSLGDNMIGLWSDLNCARPANVTEPDIAKRIGAYVLANERGVNRWMRAAR